VRALLRAGADVNARDTNGETPLDWAEKFGYAEVIAELKQAGAKQGVAYVAPKRPESDSLKPVESITRALKLLETTSADFFKESGCVGCHHQPLVARAQHAAKVAGIAINEAAAKEQLAQMRGQWLSLQEEFLQSLNPGGGANRLAENLRTMEYGGRRVAVFAMLKDKDIAAVIDAVRDTIDAWFIAPLGGPRGADTDLLRAAFLRAGVIEPVSVFPDVEHAFSAALEQAQPDDKIVVFGSFYTVAAALHAR